MFYWQISILDSRIKFRWAHHEMPINLFPIISLSENQNKKQTVPSKSQIITLLCGAFETKSWRMLKHVSLNWFLFVSGTGKELQWKILVFKWRSFDWSNHQTVPSKSKIIIVFFFHCTSRRFQNKKPTHATTQNFVSLNYFFFVSGARK